MSNSGASLKKYFYMFFDSYFEHKCRNQVILSDAKRPIKENRINVHYYDVEHHNIGDALSPVIVDFVAQKLGLNINQKVNKTRHLYAIGSVLFFGYQNCVVWGSGFLDKQDNFKFLLHRFWNQKMDIRAVRGPKTRQQLIEHGYKCPEVYGDPAILLPLFYQPSNISEDKKDYVVIRHLSSKLPSDISPQTDNYKEFIDKLCCAKLVLSSSLHGLILAEAYGIPAILLVDEAVKDTFKYEDYFLSTGRTTIPTATSVEEALNMPLPAVPDLEKNRKMLLDSFPVDMWK